MAFKWEKLTVKSQEAVQAAASTAAENGNPGSPAHASARGTAGRPRRRRSAGPRRRRRARAGVAGRRERGDLQAAQSLRRLRAAEHVQRAAEGARPRQQRSRKLQGRLRLHRAPAAGADRGQGRSGPRRAGGDGRDPRCRAEGALRRARLAARHRPEPRGQVPGAGEVRQRPHRTSRARASSTPSSAATKRFAAWSRCSRAGPRTTPS